MEENKTSSQEPPKLVKRREHKNSTFQAGRTIGEKREKLETANERAAARKKDKRKKAWRIIATTVGFLCLIGALIFFCFNLMTNNDEPKPEESEVSYAPTIEVVDESSDGKITSRMREYIGQVESDLKSLGITPVRAVVPTGAIREVRFYLDGYTGYVKMIIDRGAGVSAEDTSRMLNYLSKIGVNDFEYIDVRIEGKAFWK
ncbi:hypothetical protein J6S37_00155 [Candidatus Saccharibacteria bacterium]|nr:hypothetical protein [Candidatus Saccharibacteria bacterium]